MTDTNKYEVLVGGSDTIGQDFIKNVVEFANKGATLKGGEAAILRFPHSVKMLLETEEELESKPCFLVFPISEPKKEREVAEAAKLKLEQDAKESLLEVKRAEMKIKLEAMEWEDFKKEVAKKGVKGRERQTMQNLYLKALV
jgi:hypothetical protein